MEAGDWKQEYIPVACSVISNRVAMSETTQYIPFCTYHDIPSLYYELLMTC